MDDYDVKSRKRKGGKPNRGGGRSNRGRGGGGGGGGRGGGIGRGGGRGGSRGGSRGGGQKFGGKSNDGFAENFSVSAKARGRGNPVHLSKRGPSTVGRTHSSGRGHMVSDVRIPMQKLHMSTENQAMVRDMLRELHGDDEPEINTGSDEEYEEEYDDYDGSDDEGDDEAGDLDNGGEYWTTDSNYILEDGGASQQAGIAYAIEEDINGHLNPYSIRKLVRYGFDKKRCQDALMITDGDIGAALEYLLSQCFDLKPSEKSTITSPDQDDVPLEEIIQQREDEMLALRSIYETNFTERIPNRVWTMKLDVPVLDKLFPLISKLDQSSTSRSSQRTSSGKRADRNVCAFFKKGKCNKGSKCKFLHVIPEPDVAVPSYSDFVPETAAACLLLYELEFRFPEGNRYPFEPPLLAFSSANEHLPLPLCLVITDYLSREAVSLAESGLPAVFSLVSLLEDESKIRELKDRPPIAFSFPEPVISRFAVKNESESELEFSRGTPVTPAENQTRPVLADSSTLPDRQSDSDDDADPEPAETVPVVRKSSRRDILPRRMNPQEVFRTDRRLKDRYRRQQTSKSYKTMMSERGKLPAWDAREEILHLIANSQVVVVSGMTGCGKTTQVPQFILDNDLTSRKPHLCNIVCTQPRRISAVAVAGRVAEERVEKVGGIVGYQIRLESIQSASTRLLFCTTGIILRRLEGDPMLEGVTHVIIDEVHERTEESDFLMMVLRDLLPSRRDLKVILMSATVNADLFSRYFGGCPVIEIPGKMFPVTDFYLEDAVEFTRFVVDDGSPYARPLSKMNAFRDVDYMYGPKGSQVSAEDQIEEDLYSVANTNASQPAADKIRDENLSAKQLRLRYPDYKKSTIKTLAMMDYEKINYELIEAIMEWFVEADHEYPREGAILIFLPGFAEIQTLFDQLQTSPTFGGKNKQWYKIIPLHSSLSSEDQHAVFSRPREGVTKIVIATNIAETSITIDDVVCVIDGGRMKEKTYDASKGMESLDMVWVSRANAVQRRGRAGRVASGICFHMFTSHRFDYHFREQPIPEIQRAPLEQLVLKIKMLDLFRGEEPEDVLFKLLEPPAAQSISSAIQRLQALGALNEESELTPLGYHLGSLPVDVRIGKLMLFGAIFRCLDPALTIAATLSFKSPFVSPFGKKEEATAQKLEFAVGNSDHLTMLNAYKEWVNVRRRKGPREAYGFCRDNFLSIKTLQMLANMKQQFVELLSDIGFVKEGITVRDMERAVRDGDGVLEVTGVEANSNSNNLKLVGAILVGALYPNVVKVMSPETKFSQSSAGAVPRAPKPEELKFKTKMDGYVHIHPSSVNFQVRYYDSPYLVYHEKVKTSKVYIRDATMVSVYSLLMFSGGNLSVDLNRGNFVMSVDDGWIRFLASSQLVAELVRELRCELDQLLEDKIETPNIDLATCPRGSKIITTIVKLISTQ